MILHYQLDKCLWKNRCPQQQQSQNMAKKSYIFTLPHPQGHGMSVKCEEPVDELTFHFGYCIIT